MRPSVVSVHTIKNARPVANRRGQRQEVPDELRRFFGDDIERFFDIPERGFEQQDLGSGVIVSAEGHIVTNNHVVQRADEVTVTLHEGGCRHGSGNHSRAGRAARRQANRSSGVHRAVG